MPESVGTAPGRHLVPMSPIASDPVLASPKPHCKERRGKRLGGNVQNEPILRPAVQGHMGLELR